MDDLEALKDDLLHIVKGNDFRGLRGDVVKHERLRNPDGPAAHAAICALEAKVAEGAWPDHQWPLGTRVTKTKGSKWTGKVVGYYSTDLTPVGYAVESETETGSVQIYPVSALTMAGKGEGV